MILRISSTVQRVMLVVAAFGFAFFLSYFSIRSARASHYSSLQTSTGLELATHLEPDNYRTWYQLGRHWQYKIEDADDQKAIRAYLAALSFNPRSAEAWLDLASAYEWEGNLDAARDAFLHAKKAYPLSPEVPWRYGNFLLLQGELEPAFLEMRHAVEADPDPELGAEAFSRALRVEPNVEKILDGVLPPRADVYVEVILAQTKESNIDNALKVWDRLATIHPRLRLNDVFFLVDGLIDRRRISEARRVWDQAVGFAGLSGLEDTPGSLLWDGGFESGIFGGGFSWRIWDSTNPQIATDSWEKHSGNRSLRLMFNGKSNLDFRNICHYVSVQPSSFYQFSAWVRTESLTSEQGVRFQLFPFGQQGKFAAFTSDVRGSQPWTRLEMPWFSGKDVQEVQVCIARFHSDEPENKIQGMAWVDDVSLVPASPEHSQP